MKIRDQNLVSKIKLKKTELHYPELRVSNNKNSKYLEG